MTRGSSRGARHLGFAASPLRNLCRSALRGLPIVRYLGPPLLIRRRAGLSPPKGGLCLFSVYHDLLVLALLHGRLNEAKEIVGLAVQAVCVEPELE